MDESAPASIRGEDGAENKPCDGETTSENSIGPRTEDTADINITCEDCGLKFTHQKVYENHLHQHALEDEEEEEAKMEDSRTLEADVEDGDVSDGANDRSLAQAEPSEMMQGLATVSMNDELRNVYVCLVCGKIYTYLVSFKKHQLLHEAPSSEVKKQAPTEQKLKKYECPDCGVSFIRRTRLLNHLRVHRSRQWFKPSCDQCNRTFSSIKSWVAHVDMHKQNPFWCLSCTQGFRDEASLDKHMQSHGPRHSKSSDVSTQLGKHVDTHTAAKAYCCKFCGRRFSHHGRLTFHQRMHLKGLHGSSGVPQKSSALHGKGKEFKKERQHATEEPDEENVQRSESQSEDVTSGEQESSEESDCGEPVHHFRFSKPLGPSDEMKSDTAGSQTRRELDERESQEANKHRQHKYWEWECIECDMGFDQVEKLHLHYMKHATGELPIPQDDAEG
uniref:C2H2-type domain-containing protein n=1 Tax=Stegastes partitus TaxID=144197 RepID=A0A3B5BKP6_9TELE